MKAIKIIILILIISSCRKDHILPTVNILCNDSIISHTPCMANYNDYTSDSFDFFKTHLINITVVGPTNFYPEDYKYNRPVFNPNNSSEIIYSKKTPGVLVGEIWKFNFCTGQATKITDDYYYNLDWSSTGWILYTGVGHKIRKIKDNGDSLTILSTEAGYNRAGKWNPSGTLYWNQRNSIHIKDINGDIHKAIIYKPLGWINDSTVLTQSTGYAFYSFNINSEELTQLNNNWASSTGGKIFDRDNMQCYVSTTLGEGNYGYFFKYDLTGTNIVDTVLTMYNSYSYHGGDIANNKIITVLTRTHWKNWEYNHRWIRLNILMMNLDGTDERLVELP